MKLIVKNFGPLRDVEINSKKLVLLIGPQASGKSVLAKLTAIFEDIEFLTELDFPKFLDIYNINFLHQDTVIVSQHDNFYIKWSDGELHTDLERKAKKSVKEILRSIYESNLEKRGGDLKWNLIVQLLGDDTADEMLESRRELWSLDFRYFWLHKLPSLTIYIPTERLFLAGISDFMFNLLKSDIPLPRCIINYGAFFEKSRKVLKSYKPCFVHNIEYRYEDDENILYIDQDRSIKLSQSSSGLQAALPMAMVIENEYKNKIENESKDKIVNFVIEEPELNLYPTTQKRLVEFLGERCLSNNNRLVITTHSPYILTSFSNLIQAHNTAKMKPAARDEVAAIIPEESWINFEDVSAFYIADGTATNILDYENRTIDATAIDDVSEEIAQEYESLLKIKYRKEL